METIGIVGLGLIGGSLGLALKRGQDRLVIGFSRSRESCVRAQERGAIDKVGGLEEVAGAEVVILASPILTLKEVLAQLSPHLRPGVVVTDTASTKVQVMAWAKQYLPQGVNFIGGHPMAGREKWGIEAALPDLFQGASYCLVPAPGATSQALARVVELVKAIGARPLFLEAEEHDFLVAGISHLPLLVSVALVQATGLSPLWPRMEQLAATGFRDVTRLASGSPTMSRDICLTNQGPISQWLEAFLQELKGIGEKLSQGGKLEEVFAQARQARQDWLSSKKWK